jgi:hypothetical protein
MNSRRFPIGHVTQAILLLGGIWLIIAPQWVGFPRNLTASRIDEWAGAVVIVVSAASFFWQWALGLRDLVKSRMTAQDGK